MTWLVVITHSLSLADFKPFLHFVLSGTIWDRNHSELRTITQAWNRWDGEKSQIMVVRRA